MPSAPLIPKIPPLRTDIQEPQQTTAVNRPPAQGASNGSNTASNGSAPQHRTSKEWYYYWSAVGKQVIQNTQTLGGLVTYGPHADRPDPSTMPNGALAVESDRGVIYQNELINGVPTWFYVAGTMWGTLSPDQRPTDLGVHDAGFDFRTTDAPPREFIWSQAAWVEVTPIAGAAGLTHPNVVTRVGTVGQIVEGGITDESAADSAAVHITSTGMIRLNPSGGNIVVIGPSTPYNDPGNPLQVRVASNRTIFIGSSGGEATIQAVNDAVTVNTPLTIQASAYIVPGLPGSNPGAGTHQLWFDPSDGNRVKYSP